MAKRPPEPPSSEITPEALYLRRREFIKNAVLFTGSTAAIGGSLLWLTRGAPRATVGEGPGGGEGLGRVPGPGGTLGGTAVEPVRDLRVAVRGRYTVNEKRNSYEEITTYNNFYEFGSDKSDPAANA